MGNYWSRTPVPEEAPAAVSASTHAIGPPPGPSTAPTPPPPPRRPTPVTEMTENGSAPSSKRVAMDLSDRAIHLCAQDAILAVQNRALRCARAPSPCRRVV